jgi:hypothetical protein
MLDGIVFRCSKDGITGGCFALRDENIRPRKQQQLSPSEPPCITLASGSLSSTGGSGLMR